MTRKQAISQAISILSKDAKNSNIVSKLKELESELPLSRWTKESILDSIATYAEEHNGILPLASDLTTENNLPSNTVIEAKFHISSMEEFFNKYFPDFKSLGKQYKSNSPYKNENIDYFITVFKNNYDRIIKNNSKKVSTKNYDKYRNKNTPTLITILRNCNCKNYSELLILCGYKNKTEPIKANINVTFIDEDWRNEELRNLFEEMEKAAMENRKKQGRDN